MSSLVTVSLLRVRYLILRHAFSMMLTLYRPSCIHLHHQHRTSLVAMWSKGKIPFDKYSDIFILLVVVDKLNSRKMACCAFCDAMCFTLYDGLISVSSIQFLCSRQSSLIFSVTEVRRRGFGEEKVQKCFSRSPSSAPECFYGEFERKLENRLPRIHSSALPFHPLTSFHSHISRSVVFSRFRAHTSTSTCKCVHAGDPDTFLNC